MLAVLTVSTVLLTVCVLALAASVFVLARQIGVLHERLSPIGVQPILSGLRSGQVLPRIVAHCLDGTPFPVGGLNPSGRFTILMFVSADCPVCKRAFPVVQAAAEKRGADLVLVGEGNVEALLVMTQQTRLHGTPLLTSIELLLLMQIDRLPTLIILDPQGVIVARDLAGTRSEIEALVATLPPATEMARTEDALHVAV
ncbi:alkyl hydroperoxide reductase [Acetobacter sp. LMG 1636]|uniref:Alkyl hydroperoxide reductase n=2 Tax=Acetobacter fallax TaxID=1737473 RepID=A0ABX0K9Z8_9PROT|nr:alkyl hydroperoxide reductase [Acetobacter fallax]NHO36210.1 alkyl hydroperoxide reductase [Acetobacter fallax]